VSPSRSLARRWFKFYNLGDDKEKPRAAFGSDYRRDWTKFFGAPKRNDRLTFSRFVGKKFLATIGDNFQRWNCDKNTRKRLEHSEERNLLNNQGTQ
jgi:hypothetical protein